MDCPEVWQLAMQDHNVITIVSMGTDCFDMKPTS